MHFAHIAVAIATVVLHRVVVPGKAIHIKEHVTGGDTLRAVDEIEAAHKREFPRVGIEVEGLEIPPLIPNASWLDFLVFEGKAIHVFSFLPAYDEIVECPEDVTLECPAS